MPDEHEAINVKLDFIMERVDRTDQALHGNGREGLVAVVTRHTQTLGVFKKLLWSLVSIAGVVVGAILIAAIL